MPTKFYAFHEEPLYELTQRRLRELADRMVRLTREQIVTAESTTLADDLINEFSLEAPEIDFDRETKSQGEALVDDDSGFGAIVRAAGGGNRQVRRQIITYHLPVRGDTKLLRLIPNNHTLSAPIVYVQHAAGSSEAELCFDVVRPSNNPQQVEQDRERVRQEAEQHKAYLKTYSQHLAQDIVKYNEQVRAEVQQRLTQRKKSAQDNDDFLKGL